MAGIMAVAAAVAECMATDITGNIMAEITGHKTAAQAIKKIG